MLERWGSKWPGETYQYFVGKGAWQFLNHCHFVSNSNIVIGAFSFIVQMEPEYFQRKKIFAIEKFIFVWLQQKKRVLQLWLLWIWMRYIVKYYKRKCWFCLFQVIARIVDGSKFDEFKTMYGETLVTGEPDQWCLFLFSFDSQVYGM